MPAARTIWCVLKRTPYPLLAASIAGWGLLVVNDASSLQSALCLSSTTPIETIRARLAAAAAVGQPFMLLAWAAMLLAMMPPLLTSPLRHVWQRSLTRRRIRAIGLFVFGYALVWLSAGLLLAAGALALQSIALAAGLPPLAAAALVAMAWQATPLKQMSLNRCHGRLPLAAFGFRAEMDVLRYGAFHGICCVGACWALMLLPLAADGPLHWIVMAAVGLVAIIERVRAPSARRWGAAWPRLPQLPRALLIRRGSAA
jgi:predicted metal-binding membrane protein